MEGSILRLMYMENTRPSIAGLIFVWITAVNEAKYNDPITPSNAVNTTNQTKALGESRPEAVNPVPRRMYVRLINVILLIDTQGNSPQ